MKTRNSNNNLRSKLDAAWTQSQNNTVNQDVLWKALSALARDVAVSHYRGNPCDIEDVVQEAALAVYTGLPSFNSRARFSTWVWRIIDNCCKDMSEAERTRLRHVGGCSIEELPNKDFSKLMANQGSKIEAQEASVGIAAGLIRLPPEQQQIVRLHLAGASFREIAAQLNSTQEAVKKRWQTALEILNAQDV